jgi:hypothetical protein
MSCKQIIRDMGYNLAKKDIMKMNRLFTKVGLPENGTTDGDRSMSEMITIGAVQEFGSPKKNIPPRPFVSGAFEANLKELKTFQNLQFEQVMKQKKTPEIAIAAIGEWMVGRIKRLIDSNIPPALSEKTIKRKGSSRSLIDTGAMKNSIQHKELYV